MEISGAIHFIDMSEPTGSPASARYTQDYCLKIITLAYERMIFTLLPSIETDPHRLSGNRVNEIEDDYARF